MSVSETVPATQVPEPTTNAEPTSGDVEMDDGEEFLAAACKQSTSNVIALRNQFFTELVTLQSNSTLRTPTSRMTGTFSRALFYRFEMQRSW
jgi:hypothetical protein